MAVQVEHVPSASSPNLFFGRASALERGGFSAGCPSAPSRAPQHRPWHSAENPVERIRLSGSPLSLGLSISPLTLLPPSTPAPPPRQAPPRSPSPYRVPSTTPGGWPPGMRAAQLRAVRPGPQARGAEDHAYGPVKCGAVWAVFRREADCRKSGNGKVLLEREAMKKWTRRESNPHRRHARPASSRWTTGPSVSQGGRI